MVSRLCNSCAENDGVVCREFRWFGVRRCPETPRSDVVCGVTKRHFCAGFLDFEWGRSIVKKYGRTEADKSMVKFHRQKRRILFAEDNEEAWEIVELALPECKLTFARNFEDGLRLAWQGYFDLYILDNWLPGGSGIDLCRAIREFDPYTPILFYSACAYA